MLADYEGKDIGIICEECQFFKILDGSKTLSTYGDKGMPDLLADLARDLVECTAPPEGYRNRCRLHFYKTIKQRSEASEARAAHRIQIADIRNWYIVVAKCQHCRNVAEIPLKTLRAMAGNDTVLDNVVRRLRCKKCTRKGEAFLTIGKQPR